MADAEESRRSDVQKAARQLMKLENEVSKDVGRAKSIEWITGLSEEQGGISGAFMRRINDVMRTLRQFKGDTTAVNAMKRARTLKEKVRRSPYNIEESLPEHKQRAKGGVANFKGHF